MVNTDLIKPVSLKVPNELTDSQATMNISKGTTDIIQKIEIIGAIILAIVVILIIVVRLKRKKESSMEKKNLSAVDISKKLIWEYIVNSFIFGIISYFLIGIITKDMENSVLKLITKIICSTIVVFIYVWTGSRNIIQRYFIRKEDISLIIRNISIFFVIMIILGFILNYNSYQRILEEKAEIYSNLSSYNYKEMLDEYLNVYKNNGSYADVYSNMKEKQQEKFKEEFSKKYGYIPVIYAIYDIGLYGLMIFLQRKWLLNVAE